MTGAWRGGMQWGRPVAYSVVTTVAGGSAFTKGAWLQISAATPTDSTWAQIMLRASSAPTAATAVDIGVGAAGSEVVVVSNLIASAVGVRCINYLFPLNVAAGIRVAARVSSTTASEATSVQFNTWDDTYASNSGTSGIDTYGFLSGTNLGTLIDPGATPNTKAGYAEITAATTRDISGFFLGFDNQSDATSGTVGTVSWLADIAVGAAGSERAILPNYSLFGYSVNAIAFVGNMASPYFPIQIPAGSRIAAQAQCSTGTAPDRLLGLTLYGVR